MEAEQIRRIGQEGVVTTAADILAAYKALVHSLAPYFFLPVINSLLFSLSTYSKADQVAKPEIKEAIDFFGRTIAIKPLTAEELGKYFLYAFRLIID